MWYHTQYTRKFLKQSNLSTNSVHVPGPLRMPSTGNMLMALSGPSQYHLLSKVTKGSIPFFGKYSTLALYESPTHHIRNSAGILWLTMGKKPSHISSYRNRSIDLWPPLQTYISRQFIGLWLAPELLTNGITLTTTHLGCISGEER